MARNFFYEHLWNKAPLLGFDFLFQAAFWCVLWGVSLGAVVLGWLNRGLDRQIEGLVARLSPEGLFDSLFADVASRCQAIRRLSESLREIEAALGPLERQVGSVEDLGLGRLNASPGLDRDHVSARRDGQTLRTLP
jgi:hypothetical protein